MNSKQPCEFSRGESQNDAFSIQVLPRPADLSSGTKIAVLDPKGETTKLLTRLGMQFHPVDTTSDLSAYDTLIIGKEALTSGGPGPQLDRVHDGLRVIVFEQNADALESRLGFRVAQYGLRQVFPRIPDHPILAGLTVDHLLDWRRLRNLAATTTCLHDADHARSRGRMVWLTGVASLVLWLPGQCRVSPD